MKDPKRTKTNAKLWEGVLSQPPKKFQKWFLEEKRFLQKTITRGSNVLDVGCGNGRSIWDIINITENVVGLDHNQKAVLDSSKKFSSHPKVRFIYGEATNLPFADGSFEFIICMGTFANFGDDKFKVLSEMSRVLKDSGKVVISVYSEKALEERMKIYKVSNAGIKKIEGNKVIFDKRIGDNISEQFSLKELQEIFKRVNLKIKKHKEVDIAYICLLTKTTN